MSTLLRLIGVTKVPHLWFRLEMLSWNNFKKMSHLFILSFQNQTMHPATMEIIVPNLCISSANRNRLNCCGMVIMSPVEARINVIAKVLGQRH